MSAAIYEASYRDRNLCLTFVSFYTAARSFRGAAQVKLFLSKYTESRNKDLSGD